jgi:hypothetical protein
MDGEPSAEDAEAASGLNQSDYEASVATLKSVSDSLDADCVLLRERVLSGGSINNTEISPDARRTGQYLIRRRADCKVCLEKKIVYLLIIFIEFGPVLSIHDLYVVQVFNRSSRRKRGMASNPLFIIPDFILHFPKGIFPFPSNLR